MKNFDVYPLYPIHITRGLGSWVYDENGQAYLDFYGGHAVISVGHGHPHYIQKLKNQLDHLAFYSNSVINRIQDALAEKLGQMSGYENYALFLVNSGAEANENALKLASFHTGKSKIIAFKKGFHGRTSAAVNITDNQSIIAPINRGFPVELLEFGDDQELERLLKSGEVAAVILEGIQGIAGIYQPDSHFLKRVQELCRQYGVIFIIDEIQSGYGRSGKFFAHQHVEGIIPDLITVAKGMGNGFPVGGVLISPVFQARHGQLGTTFGGNHLACAAALAVLEIMNDEKLIAHAGRMGEKIISGLSLNPGIREIRGMGLMIGLELEFPSKDFRQKLLTGQKLFTGSSSNANTIRLLPPLTVTEDEVDLGINKIKEELNNFSQI